MHAEKITAIHGDSQIQFLSGTIESIDEQNQYRIIGDAGHYTAGRAFSCLVEPIAGDTVIFSRNEHLQCHILSVIERAEGNETSLSFPGAVSFRAAQGPLNLHAQQGVCIGSEQEISMASEEYTLLAKKAFFSVDNITATGASLMSKISNIKVYADTVETVADNLLQKLKNAFRLVEGVEQTKSRDTIITVKNLYTLRSRQSAILAKKDMKIDAERIHMG